ncbi:MAG: 2-oxo acid dehydrogenase subunit E2 [Caldilinea sp.]|nr:2-oxo acid dehydrogenase subunit E2 [Caldilinea sp.]MDW8440285.1 dihydrolipoamide acetyltransferase family protein [Caldilineaceae bacterium]
MATEIRLPDLGEGVQDVTVNRWRVAVGDAVKAGDVILEIATDKVDTEIQAPADGVLLKINYRNGEIAPVDAVMGYIGAPGEKVEGAAEEEAAPAKAAKETKEAAPEPAQPVVAAEAGVRATPVAKRVAAEKGVDLAAISGTGPGGQITKQDVLAYTGAAAPTESAALPGDLADKASLPVRRLAAEHNLNLRAIAGDRPLSALTVYDVLSAIASREAGKPVRVEPAYATVVRKAPAVKSEEAPAPKAAPETPAPTRPAAAPVPSPVQLKPGEELVKLSRMRLAVARNTTQSLFTAPHVTTMWDVDMTAVLQHRAAHKKEFAAVGVNLTLTAYFIEAVVAGLKAVPAANATWTDEGIIIKRYYNIGMATALPMDQYGIGGLIVPVIKNAGELNLLGIARAVNDLAERARKGELKPEDLADGTFTVSNYGTSGSRFQTPIIVQPQVGILGIGVVEKRPVVVSSGHPLEPNMGDALVFKAMTTLGFSYDHRVLDGATADAFCAAVKKHLESYTV